MSSGRRPMSMMPSLVFYFTDKLERMSNGYTPGGAVFPYGLVLKYDEANNSLQLAPDTMGKKDECYWLGFTNMTIVVHESKGLRGERR